MTTDIISNGNRVFYELDLIMKMRKSTVIQGTVNHISITRTEGAKIKK